MKDQIQHPTARQPAPRSFGIILALLVAGCVSNTSQNVVVRAQQQSGYDVAFADSTSIDANVPSPESILGHRMGDGAVRYESFVRYLKALADASPFVTIAPYAQTHEGRTLYYLTITSKANHDRLDQIKAANAKLADPRKMSSDVDAEAERIIADLPGIAWMAYGIHGDELSSVDAACQLAYHLAAGTDENTKGLRNDLVIHIDPSMNPDGRERYLSQLQSLSGKVPNPDYQAMQHSGLWSAGRGNHYLFDLNRDWLMQVHPETRGRAAKMIEWNPHLVVDSHEMGPLDTYLFDPPREPRNNNLSPKNLQWRRAFSADQARAFDKHGWSYYTGEWYEEWYPGYTNSWANLQGAVGLLYEQAGVDADGIRQAAGKVLTYREAVHHHYVSSLANLNTLRENRAEILADYFADRVEAIAPSSTGEEFFLVEPPANRALFDQFVELLKRQGLDFAYSASPFDASETVDIQGATSPKRTFRSGTLIVEAAQPRRRLLRALLEFDPRMTNTFLHEERTDIENHRGTRSYDVSAWNIAMAYDLEAYWAKRIDDVETVADITRRSTSFPSEPPAYGFLIDGASRDIYRAVVRLLDLGVKVRAATKIFTVADRSYQPGTVLLRNYDNNARLMTHLRDATEGLNLDLLPANSALSEKGPDLGGNRFALLQQPRVALITQWPISSTSFGAIWHLLDARIGLRVSPVSVTSLRFADLRKYNVIILPNAWNTGGLTAILNESTRNRLKQWMESGGTLIAMGNTAAFFANKEFGISAVRRRRDVLNDLDEYKEALQHEQQAHSISLDDLAIWGDEDEKLSDPEESEDTDSATSETPSKTENALKRHDAWLRLFRPSGAIVSAVIDQEHWLTFGLSEGREHGNRMPVLLSGGFAYLSKYPTATPVRLAGESTLRLSGLLWPEARERWADSAYATVERIGYGQLILFANDPFFRGYFEGTGRLLLNAIILGPGVGASQSVPW